MATASKSFTFTDGTTASASQVNANFDDLINFLNSSVLHTDGSNAFVGDLDAGGHKLTNLAPGVASTDAATVSQLGSAGELPAGVIVMTAKSSADTGWLLCDGGAVSRTTYSTLFTAIGTTYGSGDGSTTFNLPDLSSRFPAGKGSATWSNTLGETGGTKDATLVSHDHGHARPYDTTSQRDALTGSGTYVPDILTDRTSTEGESATDKNLPPYITLNFQIKTGA